MGKNNPLQTLQKAVELWQVRFDDEYSTLIAIEEEFHQNWKTSINGDMESNPSYKRAIQRVRALLATVFVRLGPNVFVWMVLAVPVSVLFRGKTSIVFDKAREWANDKIIPTKLAAVTGILALRYDFERWSRKVLESHVGNVLPVLDATLAHFLWPSINATSQAPHFPQPAHDETGNVQPSDSDLQEYETYEFPAGYLSALLARPQCAGIMLPFKCHRTDYTRNLIVMDELSVAGISGSIRPSPRLSTALLVSQQCRWRISP
ncbi:hypothetical protein CBER1_11238 [Cercospora berteroae]|uniref:Uncharacterized protein n=1 Tax=Cercospora berteroae TaxID=357750 RepID=A0A2S6CGZ9_9PEZI|nr:hypothetical protein CBER1_11238 [Cercospora berteroae]